MSDLAVIHDHLGRCRKEFAAAARSVPEEKWQDAPSPGRWSAAEVVAHVTLVEKAITDGARKLIEAEPRRFSMWERLHLPLMLVAWRGVRRESPIPLDRSLLAGRSSMLERLDGYRASTLDLLDTNRSRDLRDWRWKHPFFGALNYYEWFHVLAYHDLRHAKQIREIVDSFRK